MSCVIWREDVMPSSMAPGSRSFFALSVLYAASRGFCMAMRQHLRVDPPDDDELLDENYEHPFQPVPILLDFILKMVLSYFIQHRIMNRADLDKSQHVSSSLLID